MIMICYSPRYNNNNNNIRYDSSRQRFDAKSRRRAFDIVYFIIIVFVLQIICASIVYLGGNTRADVRVRKLQPTTNDNNHTHDVWFKTRNLAKEQNIKRKRLFFFYSWCSICLPLYTQTIVKSSGFPIHAILQKISNRWSPPTRGNPVLRRI